MRNLLFFSLLVLSFVGHAQPTINSFMPISGPIGTSVTINGTNFNTTPSNNVVYFGATRATVSSASATSLTVVVPAGATYTPISVLNSSSGLTVYSAIPFLPTFPSKHSFTAQDLAARTDIAMPGAATSPILSDFDGDGLADILIANAGYHTVSVLRNISTAGNISFATKAGFPTGQYPFYASVGDIDGDGKPDIVVANMNGGGISILRNTSRPGIINDSSFALKIDIATGGGATGIAIGDVDGDGKPDLAITNSSDGNLSIIRNISTPGNLTTASFEPKIDIAIGNVPQGIAIRDLDGDGKPDLIITRGLLPAEYAISIVRNISTPGSLSNISFAAKVDLPAGNTPRSIAVSDIDQDGKPDLLISNERGTGGVSVFRNIAVPGSITSSSYSARVDFLIPYPGVIGIGDIDGDGKPDMLTGNGNSTIFSVFRNTVTTGVINSASFERKDINIGVYPSFSVVGDIDGDNIPDLLLGANDNLSFYRNTPQHVKAGTVTISSNNAYPDKARAGSIVTVTFTTTEPVQTPTVTVAGQTASLTNTTGNTWKASYTLQASDSAGTVPFSISLRSIAYDLPGVTATATTNGSSVFYDKIIPVVASIQRLTPAVAVTKSPTLVYRVNFSKPVIGATTSAFQITCTTSTLAVGIMSSVSSAGGMVTSVDVSVKSVSGQGKLRLDLNPGLIGIVDSAGNNLSDGFKTGQEYTIDSSALPALNSVIITSNNTIPKKAKTGSIVTLTFNVSEPITTPVVAIAGHSPTVTDLGNNNWRAVYTLSAGDTEGQVPFSVNFTDLKGISGISISSTTDLSSVFYDKTPPALVSIKRLTPSGSVTNATSIVYRATFSEPVITVNSGSFQLTTTGTATGSISSSIPVPTPYTADITINSVTGNGMLRLENKISGSSIRDSAFNTINTTFTDGETYTIDKVTMAPSFTAPAASTLNTNPVTITGNLPEAFMSGSAQLLFNNGISTTSLTLSNSLTSPFSFPLDITNPTGSSEISIGAAIPWGTFSITLSYRDSVGNTAATKLVGGVRIRILQKPIATTLPAVATAFGATLSATANDNSYLTTAVFEYDTVASLTSSVHSFTGTDTVPDFYGNKNITRSLTQLIPGTTYYYRINATNAAGTTYGEILSFRTPFVPEIFSFSPVSGPVGTLITINGAHFNSNISNNIVRFGATNGQVVSGNSSSLRVKVPAGASVESFTVLDKETGLAASSANPFLVNFPIVGTFGPQSFENPFEPAITVGHIDMIGATDLDNNGVVDAVGGYLRSYSYSNGLLSYDPSNGALSVFRPIVVPGGLVAGSFTTGFNTFMYNPTRLAFADIDGDGRQDVGVSSYDKNAVMLLQNNSQEGIFNLLNKLERPIGNSFANYFAFKDLDGDGKPDLVVSDLQQGGLAVYRNISTIGNFALAPKINLVVKNDYGPIVLKDIDGDNKPDIIVANQSNNSLSILRNISTPGSITSSSFATHVDINTQSYSTSMEVTDIDGDGKPDIVVGGAANYGISILRNLSVPGTINTASFAPKIVLDSAGYNFKIADMNGDGKPDIVAALSISGIGYATIFKNTATAGIIDNNSFASKVSLPAKGYPVTDINIADFDGDGKPDITLANPTDFTSTHGIIFIRNNLVSPKSIVSFLPTIGGAGSVVKITGTNFSGIPKVRFGGVDAQSSSLESLLSISAVVSSAGASGTVSVTLGNDTLSLNGFEFIPKPVITSFTPTSALPGTMVKISGLNFTHTQSIGFGGVLANSFTVNSDTSVYAVVPVTAVSGSVSLTTVGGADSLYGFQFIPPASITSFAPLSAATGATITVTGTNFSGVISATIGGTSAASVTTLSSTTILLVVGKGSSGNISITTAGGAAALSGFTYIQPPTITSFTPLTAVTGATITVTGTNFTNISSVSLGGTSVASFKSLSPTTLVAIVGNGSSGTLSITTAGGTAALSGFTYLPSPTITSFTPAVAVKGETITVTGTNLSGIISSTLGGTPVASFNVLSSTTLTVVVGTGASGPLSITTAGGTAVLTGFTFIAEPIIESFTPFSAGTGATITVTGLNLSGVLSATLGGTAVASFKPLSSTAFSIVVGNGSSGSLSITTVSGNGAKSGFVYVPPVIITGDSSFCKGDTVLLSSSALSGNQWYRNGILITGATARTYAATTTGVYKVIMTYEGVPYPSVNQINLALNASPVAAFTITGDSSQCLPGNLFRFTNTSTIPGSGDNISSRKWIFGDSLFSDLNEVPHTYKTAGTYQVMLVVISNRGCRDTTYKNILVKKEPSVLVSSPAAVCKLNNNTTINITTANIVNGSSGALVYTYWKDSAATTTLTNAAAVSVTGTYYIKGTDTSGCYMTIPVSVIINELPILAPITGDAAICSGALGVLSNSTKGGIWRSSNTAVATIDSSGNVKALSAGVTTITYTYTLSTTGCINSTSLTCTVLPLPIAGKPLLSGYNADTTTCYFSTVTISSKDTYDKYLWSNGATTSSVNLSANASMSLKVGSNQNACYSDSSVIVTVRKNLTAEPVISRVFDNLVSTGSTTYKWLFNNKLTGDTTQNIPAGAKGIYNVSTSIDRVCWNNSKDYLVFLDPVTIKKVFDLILYPNPTNGIFSMQVKFQNTTTAIIKITIADQAGVVKLDTKKLIFSNTSIKIPVIIALAPGIYVIKVDVNGEINTQQLVVI